MPIFEFICNKCENQFETIVTSTKDQNDVACRKCGSKNIEKIISSTSSYRMSSSSSHVPLGSGLNGCNSRSGFS